MPVPVPEPEPEPEPEPVPVPERVPERVQVPVPVPVPVQVQVQVPERVQVPVHHWTPPRPNRRHHLLHKRSRRSLPAKRRRSNGHAARNSRSCLLNLSQSHPGGTACPAVPAKLHGAQVAGAPHAADYLLPLALAPLFRPWHLAIAATPQQSTASVPAPTPVPARICNSAVALIR